MMIKRPALCAVLGLLGLALILVCSLTLTQVVRANDLTVCPAGPPDCGYAVIQDAVDDASDGDVIKVATGIYTDIHLILWQGDVISQVVFISKTLTIRGGYTAGDWTDPDPQAHPTLLDAQGQARGMYIAGEIQVTVENLRITGGRTGLQNYDGNSGGGLFVSDATITLRHNTLYGNMAAFGGGLAVEGSPGAIFSDNTFLTNTASTNGGGVYVVFSQASISSSRAEANTAGGWGGGFYIEQSDATLDGNTVTGNEAGTGGGIALGFGNVDLNANLVYSNTAQMGGGLELGGIAGTFTNNVISGNTATSEASGVLVEGSEVSFVHNTLAQNGGGDGSGLCLTFFPFTWSYASVLLTDTILVSHTVAITVEEGSAATLEATLWGSGHWANAEDWGGDGTIITGTTNYWGDPAFVDSGSGNYHLASGSAAIDHGVDSRVPVDIDGDPRPQGAGYDIGADEWTPPTALTGANITGPVVGYTNSPYVYSAIISPSDATEPITYTWAPEPSSGQGTATVLYQWDTPGTYSVAVEAENLGGVASDTIHIVVISAGTFATVDPAMGSMLVYTDALGNRTLIEVPGGAVTETIALIYTPVETVTVPVGFQFAGHAFDLDAYREGNLLSGLSFETPFTVTIHYSNADVAGLDPASLVLEYWTGSTWEDAACSPYDRHPEENWLVVPICHLSRFALFGEQAEAKHSIYLPLVVRNP